MVRQPVPKYLLAKNRWLSTQSAPLGLAFGPFVDFSGPDPDPKPAHSVTLSCRLLPAPIILTVLYPVPVLAGFAALQTERQLFSSLLLGRIVGFTSTIVVVNHPPLHPHPCASTPRLRWPRAPIPLRRSGYKTPNFTGIIRLTFGQH